MLGWRVGLRGWLVDPNGIGGPVCDRWVALESVRMGSEGFIQGGLWGLETRLDEAAVNISGRVNRGMPECRCSRLYQWKKASQ